MTIRVPLWAYFLFIVVLSLLVGLACYLAYEVRVIDVPTFP